MPCSAKPPALLSGDDIDFTVEGVAKFIGRFSRITIEKQVTELAQTTPRICDADAELAAIVTLFRTSVDKGNQLPSGRSEIDIRFGSGIEVGSGAITGPEPVHLWPASVWV